MNNFFKILICFTYETMRQCGLVICVRRFFAVGHLAVGQFAVRKNVSFGQVRLSQAKLGQVRSNNVRLGQVFFSFFTTNCPYGKKSQSHIQQACNLHSYNLQRNIICNLHGTYLSLLLLLGSHTFAFCSDLPFIDRFCIADFFSDCMQLASSHVYYLPPSEI